MASYVSSSLFINIIIVLFINITIVLLFPTLQNSVKFPFHPKDVLPVLPRQVSRPILYSLYSPVDLLPVYVGNVVGNANISSRLEWKGDCFDDNAAWLELHNKTGSRFGGGTLHIQVSNARSTFCWDTYVFVTSSRVKMDYWLLSREHTLDFEWKGKFEFEYVKFLGISIFMIPQLFLGTLQALRDVYPLFTEAECGESSNIAFLEKYMGTSFIPRPHPWVTNISVDDVHSGDVLVISKIRGRWGGFQTLQKWVTGTYAGHSAVCLKDSGGKLWVAESRHENEEGEYVMAILPWEEWWDFELNKDESNPHIALLPLHPETRAKFNEPAAWEYARSMVGKPYGFHNLIFSWIDTKDMNYPPPVDAHLVAAFLTIGNQILPVYVRKMWNEALNKRLETQGLSLPEILVEAEKRGSSFAKLLTIPEQDDWLYSDGKLRSCAAFIIEMYKVAGLFDPIASTIQATEFTVKDTYMLNFFETNSNRLPKWCNNDGGKVKLPFCQILGKYRMELPRYNSMKPYPQMNERCPSLPHKYSRVENC